VKFDVGNETDQAFTVTMSHEMLLCQDSFERFSSCTRRSAAGIRDKATRILRYSSYARFLHHLYEFYAACFKRDRRSTANINWQSMDRLLNYEVCKLLKNRLNAIDGGYEPAWENHRSVYEVQVSEDFGKH
jgi:hypothetical protein